MRCQSRGIGITRGGQALALGLSGDGDRPTGTDGPVLRSMGPPSPRRARRGLYQALDVPDTLDGRFDLIALHAFLLIHRLQGRRRAGPRIGAGGVRRHVPRHGQNLREIGVGDLSVGRRVRAMWEAFHGRSKAYSSAMGMGRPALAAALDRNVWRGRRTGRRGRDTGRRRSGADPPIWRASRSPRSPAATVDFCRRRRRRDDPGTAPAAGGGPIGAAGVEVVVEATAAECAALAQRMQLPSVLDLRCAFHLERDHADVLIAYGHLSARVMQTCVVSLEDFAVTIDDRLVCAAFPRGRRARTGSRGTRTRSATPMACWILASRRRATGADTRSLSSRAGRAPAAIRDRT